MYISSAAKHALRYSTISMREGRTLHPLLFTIVVDSGRWKRTLSLILSFHRSSYQSINSTFSEDFLVCIKDLS